MTASASGVGRFDHTQRTERNGGRWLLWSIWCVYVSEVAGEHASCNQSLDTVELLQIKRFPSNCFLLEDHYHIDKGVLTATLRFGPGGNAGPSDVTCIASEKVKEIVGSFAVTGALSLTSILLPRLKRVRGSLVLMQLPKLLTQTFRLDALKSVDENLVLRHNEALSAVVFDELRNVDRTFKVGSNRVLQTLSCSSLRLVGLHLLIDSNPSLELIHAPVLEEIRFDLIIGSNDALQEIDFPSLERIGEDLVVYVMDDLRSMKLPVSFIGEDAEFAHLARLQSLELPELEFVGDLDPETDRTFFGFPLLMPFWCAFLRVPFFGL